ncbi:MAG: hypothetical protein QOF76_2088 [Solirubrobacteraceae bacterium]|jgi:uncharacterized protein (DUF58 family)|nr:hypothetical protein [Solirubrobacteraceae bacterium]
MKLVRPAARQGPGPLGEGAVRAVDVAVQRRIEGQLPGEHRAVGVGSGTEIAQLRPYVVGDDVRQLDPAASARTGEPYVRQQVPERALTTWIVVDVSASMGFGTGDRLKSDVSEGVARVVARIGLRRAGKVGLLTFGAPEPTLLAPRGGRRATVAMRSALESGVAPDGHQDPEAFVRALRRLSRLARKPGLIVIISDFREADGWQAQLKGLCHRHEVVCVEVADPREAELPDAGTIMMVDPETGRHLEADLSSPKLREAFRVAEAARALKLRTDIRRAGARHVALWSSGDWLRGLGAGLARSRG